MTRNSQSLSNAARSVGTLTAAAPALCLLLLFGGCSDGTDRFVPAAPEPEPVKPQAANPTVEGPITGGGSPDCCFVDFSGFEIDLRDLDYVPGTPFFAGGNFDMGEVGYRETEYFISGTATSYINTDELNPDGIWPVQPADAAEFTSRIVVHRPIEDAAFNGTVVVEWFNVTGGLDAAPDWLHMHTEFTREGTAWVGVSAQLVGIEGGGAFDLPLKAVDAERYGALDHPGDSFSYDIFSQAAQSVRNPVGIDPLEGLDVERMIAVGQSQSASRLTTYYNAIHPTIELFDGVVIHARGDGSSALSQAPQVEAPVPEVVFLRDDQPEPVIMLQTETDVLGLQSLRSRQADSASYRLWEVAGAAHSDAYTTIKGPYDRGNDPSVADVIATPSARPPFINCPLPINDGPGHWLAKAAVASLDEWIRTGEAAAIAPRLELNAEETAYALDDLGNVLGGIRTSYVDAPVAVLSGLGQSGGFCGLFGTTRLFDEAELDALYPTHAVYVEAITSATDDAVEKGFVLPADAELIITAAQQSEIGR